MLLQVLASGCYFSQPYCKKKLRKKTKTKKQEYAGQVPSSLEKVKVHEKKGTLFGTRTRIYICIHIYI